MPCSCFGKKDNKGEAVAEEKYRPRDSKSRERESPLIPTPAPAPELSAPPPAPVTPTPGGDARLRPEDDPDKANRRRDVVASFYSDQCELIGFKATGSRPPSTHVGSSPDGPAATSSPAASSPGSTRSGASCRADLAEKRREFFKELAVEDDDSSRSGSRPTSRMTDPGFQTTPRNSHYQEHHSLPHPSKTASRTFKYSLPFTSARSSNSAAATVSEETQPLLEPSLEYAPDVDDEPANQTTSQLPQESFGDPDHSGKPPAVKSCDLLAPEPSQDYQRQDVDQLVAGGSPLPQNLPTPEIPLERSSESQQLIDLSVWESPEKNVDNLGISVCESPEKRVEPVDIFLFESPEKQVVEPVSETSETRVKSVSESSETRIQHVAETPVELVTDASSVEFVTDTSPVEFVTDTSSVELVTETPVELVTQTAGKHVEFVFESPEKRIDELVYDRSPLIEDSTVYTSSLPPESLEALVYVPSPEHAQLLVEQQQYVQQSSVQSEDERAEEGSCLLINEAFHVQPQQPSEIMFFEKNEYSGSDSAHETSQSPEHELCQDISYEFEDEPPQRSRQLPIDTTQETSRTYTDEVHQEVTEQSIVQPVVPENLQENTHVLVSPQEHRSAAVQEAAQPAAEEAALNNHPELLHHSLPPTFDSCFLTSAEEPEELLTEQSLHQSVSHRTENPAAKEWPQLSEASPHQYEEVKSTVEIVECIPKVPPPVESVHPPPTAPAQDTSNAPVPLPRTLATRHNEDEPLPPAPPTPPVDDEPLPPPPPTPPAEGKHLPPAPPTPPADDEPLPPAPPTPPISSEPRLPPATCNLDHVSSSVLEDDGLGSEIDDALSSLECLSEEGNSNERAAASSVVADRVGTAVLRPGVCHTTTTTTHHLP